MGPTTKLLRTQSDERLAALARDGHELAFEAIVERYRRPLLRAARRILPEARAEDAVQQAFLAAWRALRRGDEVRDLRPWLYRIVQHTALNALRVKGYEHDQLEDALKVAEAPQDELERRTVVRATLAGMAALPDRQREALMQTAVEGRSQAEVAAAMGLTEGAVRQLVHRARHTLRATATSVTPLPIVVWLADASRGPVPDRVAEMVAGAGAGGAASMLAKAGAVAVVAGGAVTGGVAIKDDAAPRARAAEVREAGERAGNGVGVSRPAVAVSDAVSAGDGVRVRTDGRSGRGGGEDDRSGRRGDDDDRSGSSSGPGSGDDGDDDRSGSNPGPGSGEETQPEDDDRSGSDSGLGSGDDLAADSSGPGSGDDPLEVDNSSGSGSGDALDVDNSGSGSDNDALEPADR